MNVLITGAQGFVGRHFARFLSPKGHSVLGIDTRLPGGEGVNMQIDCRDFFLADTTRFDLVIHCAAIVGGRAKIEGEPLAIADNLSIDAALFQWALRTRPQRIVYFSSSAAYPVALQGKLSTRLLHESDITIDGRRSPEGVFLPDNTYGWAKLTGEYLANKANGAGLAVSVFRPFSGYGDDQDETYPMRALADRFMRKEDPLDVWGDGQQVRDFIHIDDIVLAVMTHLTTHRSGPINLCSGVGTSFLDLIELFSRVTGHTPQINKLLDKPTGVAYRVGNPHKMLTFYEPRVCLEDGVRSMVNWW